ncbi:MAG: hypothetical protein ACYCZT_00245 [Thiobacillus sp.]
MKLKSPELCLSFLTAISLSSISFAASMADFAGTYSVTFQPVTAAGKLEGCSLVYNAVMLDYVYQNGTPVLAIGNVTYNQHAKRPGLSLKLGLTNVLSGNQPVVPPHYAFIKTKNGTTAGAKFVSYDSDISGYRVFVYQLTEKSTKLIGDLLNGENPTIGFNRSPKGVDATFPLDLSVEEIAESKNGQPQRKHSTDAIEGFRSCFSELSSSLQTEKQ